MTSPRDPETGELLFAVYLMYRLPGQPLPIHLNCRDWATAVAHLRSKEFRKVAHLVDVVTICNREA